MEEDEPTMALCWTLCVTMGLIANSRSSSILAATPIGTDNLEGPQVGVARAGSCCAGQYSQQRPRPGRAQEAVGRPGGANWRDVDVPISGQFATLRMLYVTSTGYTCPW